MYAYAKDGDRCPWFSEACLSHGSIESLIHGISRAKTESEQHPIP